MTATLIEFLVMQRNCFLFLALFVSLASIVGARQKPAATNRSEDKDVAAVRAVIDAQAASWNRGDVTGYMEGYAKEDGTTFVSGATVTRGWQTVLDRYKRNYDTPEKMGTLNFTEMEFRKLSESYIVATGHWQLTRKSDTPGGRFTLIFRRTGSAWRIVYDHTS